MNEPIRQETIYPQLPKEGGDKYRLQKSDKVLQDLESEARHYEGVRKKYSRAYGIAHNVGVGSGALGVVMTSSAVGTSLTGVGIPIAIPLGVIGGLFGLLSVLSTATSKKLSQKVSKHEKITSIAKTKVNTVKDLVGKALRDDKISDEEFSLILAESEKFEQLKQEARQVQRKKEQEMEQDTTKKKDEKETLIMNAREEILRSLLKPSR